MRVGTATTEAEASPRVKATLVIQASFLEHDDLSFPRQLGFEMDAARALIPIPSEELELKQPISTFLWLPGETTRALRQTPCFTSTALLRGGVFIKRSVVQSKHGLETRKKEVERGFATREIQDSASQDF